MNRIVTTLLVALCAVALGAGAGKGAVATLATSAQVLVTRQAPPTPSAGVQVQTFDVQELTRAFDEPVAHTELRPVVPPCDIAVEAFRTDAEFSDIPLKVGTREIRYTEHRGNRNVVFRDPEKEIALRVLDPVTCERETVVITKRGDKLIAPAGWDIEPVERSSGIRWNNWATEYRINKPEGRVVMRNLYPYVKGAGRKRTIVNVEYVSYNADLHVPALVNSGRTYMMDLAARAREELRQLGVPSRAFEETLLADTMIAQPAWLARLGPTEHIDLSEFILDPTVTMQKALVRIGTNRERFAAFTCNSSGACGLMQFTDNGKWVKGKFRPGTYTGLRKMYPEAKLIADFSQGARNPLNAMKAAYLHNDNILRELLTEFGPDILADQAVLEEMIGAGYNAGSGRVSSAYGRKLKDGASDWITALKLCKKKGQANCIPAETVGYVQKIRFIRQVWDTPHLALTE